MSKKLKITNGEVGKYEDLFRQIGSVGRGETEDKDQFMKFKYAVGRNWKKLESLSKIVQKTVAEIMVISPAYEAFMQERDALADKFADKDADGNVILTTEKDGNQTRRFTPENKLAAEAELAILKEKHAFAVAQYEKQEADAMAYLNESVEIDLYSVPFAIVAERIAGAWLVAIECMIDDPPAGE